MRFAKPFLSAAITVLITQLVYAQENVTLKNVHKSDQGFTLYATIEEKSIAPSTLQNDLNFLRQVVDTRKAIEFRLDKTFQDNIGINHKRYQAYLNGLKIEGANYVLHINKSGIYAANGFMASLDQVTTKPDVNPSEASANATRHLQQQIAKSTASKMAAVTKVAENKLVIALAQFAANKIYRLAYKIKIEANNDVLSAYVYIDAITGQVINAESLVCSTNAPGIAETGYSGARAIITDDNNTGGPFRLREVRNGVNVVTLNLQRSVSTGTAIDFTDNDNNWTAAEHPNDQAALDAHWGTEVVLDYWRTVHNRNSFDGAGMAVVSFVHYGDRDANAYWNRETRSIRYGEGEVAHRHFSSLDMCAHEFGHGVCQFTSDLAYYGESGALNEGFSDIWGATIEAWGAPAKQRWLIGEEVKIISPGFLRNMQNPNAAGHPDTFNGNFWASTSGPDNGGVHTNSSVLNYWYYLLAEGGGGTNDFGGSYAVTGIGLLQASRIAYLTEQRLASNAGFMTAKDVSIQAAIDLFGTNSCQETAVREAWWAVGVDIDGSGRRITGANTICSGSETYTIGCFPGAVTWQVVQLPGIVTFTQTGNAITLQRTGEGMVELSATINDFGVNKYMQRKITVGEGYGGTFHLEGQRFNYPAGGASCCYSVCPGEYLNLTAIFPGNVNLASQHEWSFSGPATVNYPLNSPTIYLTASGGLQETTNFTYRYFSNACGGWSDYFSGSITTINCDGGEDPYRRNPQPVEAVPVDPGLIIDKELQLIPNPAKSSVTIRTKNILTNATIRIISLSGKIVHQSNYNGQFKNVDISNLPGGLYMVRIESRAFSGTAKLTITK